MADLRRVGALFQPMFDVNYVCSPEPFYIIHPRVYIYICNGSIILTIDNIHSLGCELLPTTQNLFDIWLEIGFSPLTCRKLFEERTPGQVTYFITALGA